MLWRLLRLTPAPYFVLGTSARGSDPSAGGHAVGLQPRPPHPSLRGPARRRRPGQGGVVRHGVADRTGATTSRCAGTWRCAGVTAGSARRPRRRSIWTRRTPACPGTYRWSEGRPTDAPPTPRPAPHQAPRQERCPAWCQTPRPGIGSPSVDAVRRRATEELASRTPVGDPGQLPLGTTTDPITAAPARLTGAAVHGEALGHRAPSGVAEVGPQQRTGGGDQSTSCRRIDGAERSERVDHLVPAHVGLVDVADAVADTLVQQHLADRRGGAPARPSGRRTPRSPPRPHWRHDRGRGRGERRDRRSCRRERSGRCAPPAPRSTPPGARARRSCSASGAVACATAPRPGARATSRSCACGCPASAHRRTAPAGACRRLRRRRCAHPVGGAGRPVGALRNVPARVPAAPGGASPQPGGSCRPPAWHARRVRATSATRRRRRAGSCR